MEAEPWVCNVSTHSNVSPLSNGGTRGDGESGLPDFYLSSPRKQQGSGTTRCVL